MSARILLVEDEPGVVVVVADLLRAEGHIVESAADGTLGLKRATSEPFDLLILDWMLPGLSGVEICQAVRQDGFDGAILMLTARGLVADKVAGLKRGADDYLLKPFDSDELSVRVAALLRRVRKMPRLEQIEFGDVTADFARNEFQKVGQPVSLAPREAELLRYLLLHPGEVLTRESILAQVRKDQPHITPRTVDTHIAWLRQKLEEKPESPRHIHTIRGEGYRFEK